MKNVFRKMLLKTCFRTCFFHSLGVTRHVPSMVSRDGPDWSDDSEVSTGGTRLDRRRKPECHVRAVCGCWTTGNKPGGWCECGHVLDTEGGKTYAQELHMETARSRSKRWLRSHCSANLRKQVCAEYPELAAPVSEITTVAKEAVAVRKKLLDEALQTLRRVGSSSTAAGVPKRRCDSRGAEVEARREASYAELAQAQNCVVRDSISPTDGHRR